MLDETILSAAAQTLERLRAQGLTAVTAESCTGGLVAASLTHHPGSSEVVLGGFVTYSNVMKQALLGVPGALFESVGAVSEAVARAMAEGALSRSGADCAVSITGIAGPGGGSLDKPVGLVWVGMAETGRATRAERFVFKGTRAEVRAKAVAAALALLGRERGEARPKIV
ncbi:CinA family protein [Lichenicoccus sp.]|uniref:CinA family protein n=1 Tax=Lichenicoccus sp. TaxID=2781899 RepID=UPI003D0B9E0E